MRIVINNCFGGFSLSRKAFLRLRQLGNKQALNEPDFGEMFADGSGPREERMGEHFCSDIDRTAPELIKVIKEMGADANGMCADLKIVNIPKEVEWQIEAYDGAEWVAEKHRTWK